MSAIEIGLMVILATQLVQIVYLSSIWNRLVDLESGAPLPPIDRRPHWWWRTRI